ncbi:MAG: hypothetical protein A2Y02_03125 [Omnitrophica bacterium GWA2_52_12]|nr:MAG: hypothetical protein A2Y02_03125 [Omnitrophica bacterium GWA2_52_12]
MNFLKRSAVILCVFAASGAGVCRAGDDFQYWSRAQVKVIDTPYVDYVNYWEMRFDHDASNTGFWQGSQALAFDFFKYLGLGLNYTYLETEADNARKTANEFKYQHRLELEANPRWSWRERINFKNRNRMEFRWVEGKGSDNGRLRHLAEAEVPVHLKRFPFLHSFFVNDEIFIDFKRRTISENRVIPAGVTVKLWKQSKLKVFYMIQSQQGATWSSNQVLGSHILIDF